MPNSVLADAIVGTGRATLQAAIARVEAHGREGAAHRWGGARVVYGDTDSMFVLLPGRSLREAFAVGKEIVAEVTANNPPPVKLKLEYVYLPCMMVTKKRYVGIAYEDEPLPPPASGDTIRTAAAATASALAAQRPHEIDGVVGKWMAKGIETVRRDQCPATQKILESSLRTLFLTKDLARVKANVQTQLRKILSDRCPLSDYIFRKRVRRDYRSPPPAKWVANARELEDVGWKPQYNEIVPYVVIADAPGRKLLERCVDPRKVLRQRGHETLVVDRDNYYVKRHVVPTLHRVLMCAGANVKQGDAELPRPRVVVRYRGFAKRAEGYSGGGGGCNGLAERSGLGRVYFPRTCKDLQGPARTCQGYRWHIVRILLTI